MSIGDRRPSGRTNDPRSIRPNCKQCLRIMPDDLTAAGLTAGLRQHAGRLHPAGLERPTRLVGIAQAADSVPYWRHTDTKGPQMSSLIASVRTQRNKELEASYLRRGYYLVLPDGSRHFIAPEADEWALNRVCKVHLSDAKGWDYWVDFSHGPDVNGSPAWSNIDQTDRFF